MQEFGFEVLKVQTLLLKVKGSNLKNLWPFYTFFDEILIFEPHPKFLQSELATSKRGRDAIAFGKSSRFGQAPPGEECSCQPAQQHFFLHIN